VSDQQCQEPRKEIYKMATTDSRNYMPIGKDKRAYPKSAGTEHPRAGGT